MHWDTFWGAFLGFVLAAVLEFVVSVFRSRFTKHYSLKAIIEELCDLECSIDKALNSDSVNEIEIIIPSWEAIVQTGNILLFTSKDYFKNLMDTYLQIKILIDCEKQGNQDEIKQSRMDVKKSIDELKKYSVLKKYFSYVPKKSKNLK